MENLAEIGGLVIDLDRVPGRTIAPVPHDPDRMPERHDGALEHVGPRHGGFVLRPNGELVVTDDGAVAERFDLFQS